MKVLNFGSLNIDYTYRVDHIVAPGETISSKNLEIFPGGKGLNQSIALAKAGAEVYHAGQIGKDGLFLKKICEENGVCVSYIRETDTNTGNAIRAEQHPLIPGGKPGTGENLYRSCPGTI